MNAPSIVPADDDDIRRVRVMLTYPFDSLNVTEPLQNWRELVKRFVLSEGREEFPFRIYSAFPPAKNAHWLANYPTCHAIRDFYEICDGGMFGRMTYLFRMSEIDGKNLYWQEYLVRHGPNRSDPLIPGRHVVLGEDGGGAPIVWDSRTGATNAFWHKGGSWEFLSDTYEGYIQFMFDVSDLSEEDSWRQAVEMLRSL